jgi:hypothetical protein
MGVVSVHRGHLHNIIGAIHPHRSAHRLNEGNSSVFAYILRSQISSKLESI